MERIELQPGQKTEFVSVQPMLNDMDHGEEQFSRRQGEGVVPLTIEFFEAHRDGPDHVVFHFPLHIYKMSEEELRSL